MMYVLLHEVPYEYTAVVGVFNSIDKLKETLEERAIHYTKDNDYTYYIRTERTTYTTDITYTRTRYYSIIQAPTNQYSSVDCKEIDYDITRLD